MRLIRLEHEGKARWGRVEDGASEATLFEGSLRAGLGHLHETSQRVPLEGARLLPPAEPSKIVCVGRNYTEHIRELGNAGAGGNDLPKEPGIFLKAPNALAETGGAVQLPKWSDDFQFEGELALVIGQRCKNLRPEEALSVVLGYTCALDLTARDKQREDLQWFRAKSADRFCPLGPWLAASLDPFDLQLETRVGGQVRQSANTAQMIFDPVQLLVYISRFVTLEAGDVVLTGTPQGVGKLRAGDVVEVEISGIGTLVTHVSGG